MASSAELTTSHKSRMEQGLPHYTNDEELLRDRNRARILCESFNSEYSRAIKLFHEQGQDLHSDIDVDILTEKIKLNQQNTLAKLLSISDMKDKKIEILAPFNCDYGYRISFGSNVFINYNCTVLDTGTVYFGNDVKIGPNCSFYSVSHPLDPEERASLYEFGKPIVIEDQVWIGGSSVVRPGVRIGRGSVVGCGSVVVKDVPAYSVVAGNPAKVVRQISIKEEG